MNDDKIKKYITILQESDIDGLEISSFWGFSRIKLSKSAVKSYSHSSPPVQDFIDVPDKNAQKNETSVPKENINEIQETSSNEESRDADLNINTENIEQIKAPLVGTYFSKPKPDEPSFVKIGDKITPGKTLFIIEAMKIFNEIESEYSGKVVDIKVEDNNPVEFDQVIMTIVKD